MANINFAEHTHTPACYYTYLHTRRVAALCVCVCECRWLRTRSHGVPNLLTIMNTSSASRVSAKSARVAGTRAYAILRSNIYGIHSTSYAQRLSVCVCVSAVRRDCTSNVGGLGVERFLNVHSRGAEATRCRGLRTKFAHTIFNKVKIMSRCLRGPHRRTRPPPHHCHRHLHHRHQHSRGPARQQYCAGTAQK